MTTEIITTDIDLGTIDPDAALLYGGYSDAFRSLSERIHGAVAKAGIEIAHMTLAQKDGRDRVLVGFRREASAPYLADVRSTVVETIKAHYGEILASRMATARRCIDIPLGWLPDKVLDKLLEKPAETAAELTKRFAEIVPDISMVSIRLARAVPSVRGWTQSKMDLDFIKDKFEYSVGLYYGDLTAASPEAASGQPAEPFQKLSYGRLV